MDWLDLLAVQGTLKSLLQHHTSKASILRHSAFFTVQLSYPYTTTGKTIALSISKELLLSQDPDTILLGAYSYTDTAATVADFSTLAPYSELTASRTGNVFTINGDAAERQGVRTADTVEEIAKLLYPELF